MPATAPQSPPLRVCAIAYSFYESDGRVMRYNEALAARGDSVDVIALREPDRPKSIVEAGVRVTGVQTRTKNERSPFSYLIKILAFFLRAMVLVSWRQLRNGYDVVHVHSVPDFLVFTAWLPKLMGAKVILDIHDILPELYASKFGVNYNSAIFKFLIVIERISAMFADHIIVANDLWRDTLVRRSIPRDKVTAILNFPDRSVFSRRNRSRIDDKFVMIYPGTLNWHQGLDIAIEALALIKDSAPNAELHICGVGPALSQLKKLVDQLGLQERVRFKTWLSLREVARVIENADLGLVPKRKDSFGNEAFSTKTLEFMALGVPVIVSDTKIDVYYFNDSVVKFFKAGSADDLASCILDLIANPAARDLLVQNGLQFVANNSWDVKKELYFDIVDSLTAYPAPGRVMPHRRSAV